MNVNKLYLAQLLQPARQLVEEAIDYAERKKVEDPCRLKTIKHEIEIMIKKLEDKQ